MKRLAWPDCTLIYHLWRCWKIGHRPVPCVKENGNVPYKKYLYRKKDVFLFVKYAFSFLLSMNLWVSHVYKAKVGLLEVFQCHRYLPAASWKMVHIDVTMELSTRFHFATECPEVISFDQSSSPEVRIGQLPSENRPFPTPLAPVPLGDQKICS